MVVLVASVTYRHSIIHSASGRHPPVSGTYGLAECKPTLPSQLSEESCAYLTQCNHRSENPYFSKGSGVNTVL